MNLLCSVCYFHAFQAFHNRPLHRQMVSYTAAVVSPSIEFKTEGFILGVGANMFKIAGPVIAYGTVASVIYGVVYWLCTII